MANDYGAHPSTLMEGLRHKVCQLEDLSFSFARRWEEGNVREYQLISLEALDALMAVTAELLPQARVRVDIAQRTGLTGWSAFLEDVGRWTGPIMDMDQFEEVFDQPLGSARLPEAMPCRAASLYQTLDFLVTTLPELRKQNNEFLGFRFEGDQHILLVGATGSDAPTVSILEFDFRLFCMQCLAAIGEM